MLQMESHDTLQHTLDSKEEKYVDVHLNHLILCTFEWLHAGL
jgi:hypothetical protein